jgi:hypothetical protein
MVAVPLSWLTGLQSTLAKVGQSQGNGYHLAIAELTGYCNSVDAIIKYSERITDV